MYETLEFFEDLINNAINKADIPKHFIVTSEYFGWTITNDKTNEEVEIRIEEVY